MPRFQGVGPRIRERLLEMGYVRSNGEPDLRRFCLEHRYDKTLFYYWIKDQRTPTKELERLSADLGRAPSWLLFGVEPRHPIAGGSGEGGTMYLVNVINSLLLIGHALRAMVQRWAQALQPQWVAA